jgi:UDP-MurNAc hydroxylase
MTAAAEIRVLSHAGMLAKFGGASVLIDPWLLGSCYWRSWWNFPEAVFDPAELARVDAVILSHLHWDHWHGPSIKRFVRDRPFIVAAEPNTRSVDDLRRMGVRNVTALPHARTLEIAPGLRITMHQFGLFNSDTAIVLELGAHSVLNANDAKIAGLPLRALLKRHGPFDIAMRSHSSANARACFRVEGEATDHDDPLHYARSFQLFMDAVRPRYAVPFASNHCYLHRDTEQFNGIAVNPLRLRTQLQEMGGLAASELVVMPPGSGWHSGRGFALASTGPFERPQAYINEYRERMRPKLEATYADELRAAVGSPVRQRIVAHLKRVPRWRRVLARVRTLGAELYWPDGRKVYLEIDVRAADVRQVSAEDAGRWSARMRWPAAVFADVVMKCMYSQGLISKRFEFVGRDGASLGALIRGFGLLGDVESQIYPLRWAYVGRTVTGYARRWRELVVYAQAAWHIFVLGFPGYRVEELILRASRTAR